MRRKLSPHSALEGRVRATLAGNEIIDDMVKPGVTFHGTALSNVASIIRHGFKMPGKLVDGNLVASPRSGIAYNRGIYSSQAAFYALSYASGQRQLTPLGEVPSMRLFVCATVMGRTLRPDSVRVWTRRRRQRQCMARSCRVMMRISMGSLNTLRTMGRLCCRVTLCISTWAARKRSGLLRGAKEKQRERSPHSDGTGIESW